MNLSDVFKRVQRTFGDEAAIQVTKDDVGRWCTDAQREIAIAAGLLETTAVSTLTAGTENVVMPADLLALTSVAVNGTSYSMIPQIKFEDAQARLGETADNASYYWVYARTIHFIPTPQVDFELTLFYTRDPAEVGSLNETFDLPVAYHSRILEYCLKQAYEMDENYQASSLKGQEFITNLQTQMNQESWAQQSSYPTIRVLPEDM
jgi:hypothetical protein